MSETALVLRHDQDGVCTLTLNRPEKRNAINRDVFRQFRAHVRDIDSNGDAIGIVVLRGAGDHFCAGHDIAGSTHADVLGWLRQEVLTLERLSKLKQPVIAAVHGGCFTAGLELALAADFIIATQSARFGDTHGKWGMVPGWGISQRLPRRVGQAKALEMMFTCRSYTGAQAEAMGLAAECVPDTQLDEHISELCRTILANSWHSNAANKRLVYETDGMSLSNGISYEVMRNEGFAADTKERRAKFLNKDKS